MQHNNQRSIVISALLTTLILSIIGGGLLFSNGVFSLDRASASENVSQNEQIEAPIVVTVQPVLVPAMQQAAAPASLPDFAPAAAVRADTGVAMTSPSTGDPAVIAAYQTQLEEAYQALQEAYTQIDVLQSAQAQLAQATSYDDDDDSHEHEDREDEDDDEDDDDGREHDDD